MNKLFLNSTLLFICVLLLCCCHKDKIAPKKSADKSITSFKISGVAGEIDQIKKTILVSLPAGTDPSALKPVAEISAKATVNPSAGQAQDFSQEKEVIYTVMAEDGSRQNYTVIIKVIKVQGIPASPANTPIVPAVQPGLTVTDIDGNVYHTIKIGSQVWMVENLKTTRYRNGEAIPNVIDKQAWRDLTTGAYWDGNNDPFNSKKYGRRYNWFAVDSKNNLTPAGWRVPGDADWAILIEYLGGKEMAGGKLKTASTSWQVNLVAKGYTPVGFEALISDCRQFNGDPSLPDFSYWWSSSQNDADRAWSRYLYTSIDDIGRIAEFKTSGFFVRCIKE